MKTKLIKFFITTFVIAIVAGGVSYVSAQNAPSNGPTDPDTYTIDLPIYTGSGLQEKKGSFLSQKHIGAPVGFFKKSIYLPGSDSRLRIGSSDSTLSINPALFGDDSTEPVVVDMQNRSAARDATKFINGGLCAVATRLVTTGSEAYEFKTGNNLGNVIARQVQLTGGDPDAGEVLVSDANGNARWAKATVSGGQVVFDNDSTSPVPAGQCIAPEPIVDVCTNIEDAQPTVPTGMIKDTPGNTPGNCTVPPTVCPPGQHLSARWMNSYQVRNAGGTWESCPSDPDNVRIMRNGSLYLHGECLMATIDNKSLCPSRPAGSTAGSGQFAEGCAYGDNFFSQLIRTCINDNDIILPDEVTITGTLSTDKTITEKYQLKLLYPDPYAFSGVSIDYNSIVDSSSLLFQYPSTNVPSTIQSITIDGTNSIVIKRTVPTVPNSTAITDVVNTSFKISIPNMNKTYLIEIKDTNTTGTLDGYWSFHQIAKNGTKVIKTNGTTHASNMPDYSPLSITKTVQ